jgi:hypothetical protein
VLLSVSSLALAQPAWGPSDTDKSQAEQTFRSYLRALEDGRFDDAYALLTPGMQQLASADRWRQSQEEFADRSGGSLRYANVRATWYKDPAGAPSPGVYVAFDFDCRYANIDLCHQMLMLHQQSDMQFLVARHERTLAESERDTVIQKREDELSQ